jgi:hypothetical protein
MWCQGERPSTSLREPVDADDQQREPQARRMRLFVVDERADEVAAA